MLPAVSRIGEIRTPIAQAARRPARTRSRTLRASPEEGARMSERVIVGLVTVLTLAYLIVRFSQMVMFADRIDRRLAAFAALVALVVPTVAGAALPGQLADRDMSWLVIGAALWVSLALSLGAFASSRMSRQWSVA
jgi:hypothetical protein